ncbi:MAG: hypothetical protein KF773_10850 [Deltaproteobacteria bacterium]|nr:hypothetical protein [Deltaproteobacteria bacterium]
MSLRAWIASRTAAVNAGDVEPAALADELLDQLRSHPGAAADPDVARFRALLGAYVIPGPRRATSVAPSEPLAATHLAFSPDGRTLAASFRAHVIAIDVATGATLATIAYGGESPGEHVRIPPQLAYGGERPRIPQQLVFAPDGDALWIVLAQEAGYEGLAGCAWERRSLPALALADAGEARGRLLAIRADGTRLHVDGAVLAFGDRPLGHVQTRGAISASGTYAATMPTFGTTVCGWDLEAGTLLEQFVLPTGADLAWTVYRERLELVELVRGLPRELAHPSAVALAPDGAHVLVCGESFGAEVWDLASKQRVRKLWDAATQAVAISADGTVAAFATGDAIRIASVAAPLRPDVPWPAPTARAIAGDVLAAQRGRLAELVDTAAIDPVAALAEIAALHAELPELRDDFALARRLHRTVAPFALARAASPRRLRAIRLPEDVGRVGLQLDETGDRIVVSSGGTAYFLDAADDRVVRTLDLAGGQLLGLGDRDRLLLAGNLHHGDSLVGRAPHVYELTLFDTAGERPPVRLPGRHLSAAIHPHRACVVAVAAGELAVFDDPAQPPRRWRHPHLHGACDFVAGGALVVVRTSDGALVFDPATGELLTDFPRGIHMGGLAPAMPSTDGRAIAFRTDTTTAELATLCDGAAVHREMLNLHHAGALAAVGKIPPSWRELVVCDPRTMAPLHAPLDLGEWWPVAASADDALLVLERDKQLELWCIDYAWAFLEDVLDEHARTLADPACTLAACLDAWRDLRRLSLRPGLGAEALARVAAAREHVRARLLRAGPRGDAAEPIDTRGGLPLAVSVALVDADLARELPRAPATPTS